MPHRLFRPIAQCVMMRHARHILYACDRAQPLRRTWTRNSPHWSGCALRACAWLDRATDVRHHGTPCRTVAKWCTHVLSTRHPSHHFPTSRDCSASPACFGNAISPPAEHHRADWTSSTRRTRHRLLWPHPTHAATPSEASRPSPYAALSSVWCRQLWFYQPKGRHNEGYRVEWTLFATMCLVCPCVLRLRAA